jgi:ATP-binding cassette subfamily B protein
VLDHGKLAESGTHAGLLAKGGLYAEMWSRQAAEQRGDEPVASEAAE